MTATVSWRHHVHSAKYALTNLRPKTEVYCTLCLLLTLIKIPVNEMEAIHPHSSMSFTLHVSHIQEVMMSAANPIMHWAESNKTCWTCGHLRSKFSWLSCVRNLERSPLDHMEKLRIKLRFLFTFFWMLFWGGRVFLWCLSVCVCVCACTHGWRLA